MEQIRQSNESEAIRNLQLYLRQIARDTPDMPAPPVDGIFGTDTRNAVSIFQKSQGLPVTGSADLETWEQLYSAYRASLAKNSPPQTMEIFPRLPVGYAMKKGSTGFPVAAVQFMLRELSHSYTFCEEVRVTGKFDDATGSAVLAFQKQSALRPSGNVDVETWNALTDQYNRMARMFPRE